MKTILYIFIATIWVICLICFSSGTQNNRVLATNGNSASNLQLMARAINRRSKGRKLRRTSCSAVQ